MTGSLRLRGNRRTVAADPEGVRATISTWLPQIGFVVRSAANLSFGPSLPQLDRRIITELGYHHGLTMSALVGLIGHDKSQVSRALTRLRDEGIVLRPSLRAALTLSPAGEAVLAEIKERARVGNKLLLTGFNRAEQVLLMADIARLIRGAARLLAHEQQLTATDAGQASVAPAEEGRDWSSTEALSDGGALLPELVIPRIAALLALLQRSSFLAFRRLTALSNFESVVLTHLWECGPITIAELAQLTRRRRSQIVRTINFFSSLEIVERKRSSSSNDWVIDVSNRGSDIYTRLAEEARRRESALLEEFGPQDLVRLRGFLRRLETNAKAMLQAEGAAATAETGRRPRQSLLASPRN